MSQWPKVPLGEVLRLDLDRVNIDPSAEYSMVGVLSFGRGLFDREPINNGETSYKFFYRLRAEHLVMSQLFGWEGAIALSSESFAGKFVSPQFPTFLCNTDRLDRRFLGWVTQLPSLWTDLGSRASGMGDRRRTLTPDALFKCVIPMPPLPEQRRLVERIDALAAKIREAIGLRQQAVEESVLLAARSLENLRRRVLEKTNRVVPLCEVAKVTAGGTPSRDNPAFWGGTIPWIKTGELLDGDITTAAEHITDAGVSSSSAKLFPIDTVLIALYGQGQTRGRTGRLLIPATTNQACAAILPCDDLRPRYVQYWLRSLYREMREENHGGAQPNWNGQMIKDIRIAVPSLKEQEQIICECDASTSNFERLSQHQDNVKAELDAVLPAILDRALRGSLLANEHKQILNS